MPLIFCTFRRPLLCRGPALFTFSSLILSTLHLCPFVICFYITSGYIDSGLSASTPLLGKKGGGGGDSIPLPLSLSWDWFALSLLWDLDRICPISSLPMFFYIGIIYRGCVFSPWFALGNNSGAWPAALNDVNAVSFCHVDRFLEDLYSQASKLGKWSKSDWPTLRVSPSFIRCHL